MKPDHAASLDNASPQGELSQAGMRARARLEAAWGPLDHHSTLLALEAPARLGGLQVAAGRARAWMGRPQERAFPQARPLLERRSSHALLLGALGDGGRERLTRMSLLHALLAGRRALVMADSPAPGDQVWRLMSDLGGTGRVTALCALKGASGAWQAHLDRWPELRLIEVDPLERLGVPGERPLSALSALALELVHLGLLPLPREGSRDQTAPEWTGTLTVNRLITHLSELLQDAADLAGAAAALSAVGASQPAELHEALKLLGGRLSRLFVGSAKVEPARRLKSLEETDLSFWVPATDGQGPECPHHDPADQRLALGVLSEAARRELYTEARQNHARCRPSELHLSLHPALLGEHAANMLATLRSYRVNVVAWLPSHAHGKALWGEAHYRSLSENNFTHLIGVPALMRAGDLREWATFMGQGLSAVREEEVARVMDALLELPAHVGVALSIGQRARRALLPRLHDAVLDAAPGVRAFPEEAPPEALVQSPLFGAWAELQAERQEN